MSAIVQTRPALRRLQQEVDIARLEIRHGRFQRSMAIITAFAAIVSGFEAYVQHQRGAFANRWMWTPVWLTPPVIGSAGAALFSEQAARRVLPLVAAASLIDGLAGFGYHLRGIGRMPGGFKLGRYNIVMGPPVFAPLLVCTVGVLGLLASALRPEDLQWLAAGRPGGKSSPQNGAAGRAMRRQDPHRAEAAGVPGPARSKLESVESQIAHGRFQKLMAVTAAAFAALAGGEAYFEHLRGSYNQWVMWTPVWVTPPMIAAAAGSVRSARVAHRVLPWVSTVTLSDGLLGFFLHLRGLARMPGDLDNVRFNITYGPPLFAPLLFSAVGLLGLIASLLRRGDL